MECMMMASSRTIQLPSLLQGGKLTCGRIETPRFIPVKCWASNDESVPTHPTARSFAQSLLMQKHSSLHIFSLMLAHAFLTSNSKYTSAREPNMTGKHSSMHLSASCTELPNEARKASFHSVVSCWIQCDWLYFKLALCICCQKEFKDYPTTGGRESLLQKPPWLFSSSCIFFINAPSTTSHLCQIMSLYGHHSCKPCLSFCVLTSTQRHQLKVQAFDK